jgi:hypothetical protein
LSLHEEMYQARKTRNFKYVHLISQVHLYLWGHVCYFWR